jgi:hypothetical protein
LTKRKTNLSLHPEKVYMKSFASIIFGSVSSVALAVSIEPTCEFVPDPQSVPNPPSEYLESVEDQAPPEYQEPEYQEPEYYPDEYFYES